MTRPLRLEFAGALYHITSRGDRRENIYEDDSDRYLFLSVLGDVCETYRWVCHTYCLMDNHYHLLIETVDANLSKGMRQLNGVYTQKYNYKNGCVGHVFQGRYKGIVVDKASYLLELSRYIVLNPVRARMVYSAQEWPWSSYRATVGQLSVPCWLEVDWLLSVFSSSKLVAIDRYKEFVQAGRNQPSPWESLKNQIYLGDEHFVESMQAKIEEDKDLSEVSRQHYRCIPKALSEYESMVSDRDKAIVLAYKSGGYTLSEIGRHFGLHYSRVSRIVSRAKGKT